MDPHVAFTVYNAAAGAGKTYTLVKAYLITLLKGEYKDSYKNILAITFTNKAVAEMKMRILENLIAISSDTISSKHENLFNDLVTETGITEEKLKRRAGVILNSILHNYAAFDIVTIDTFTHRVIRTFAYDLGIPMNFEIEMDTDVLIQEAIDALISKIGIDKELTNLIVDFANSKIEDDKSWDITLELQKVAKLLFSENDRKHLNVFSNKSIQDFEELKQVLSGRIIETQDIIVATANKILDSIKQIGLQFEDFTRGSIPTHFQKLANKEKAIDFKAAWKQDIQSASFYSSKLEHHKKEDIDSIRSMIEESFIKTKHDLIKARLFQNIIKNLTPLSVLNAINKELNAIKKDRKILLISEFNTLISNSIQDQPAPFIYERLGERYRDYFIDEFQDTSELQWNNLVPLIDNAVATETLSGKKGQITIVGDAKQAIYRWRGGKAEQFIDLSADQNPFSVKEKQVLNLPRNYRSHEEVITFNNSFFTFLANDCSDIKHKELYVLGNNQKTNTKKDGYVNISFVKAKNVAEENELYPQKVFDQVLELQGKGYGLNEICIIVRKQKEGAVIADFLTKKGISIISSETLLIQNAPEVKFVIDMLSWFVEPQNLLAKINLLHFVAEQFSIQDKHRFLQKMVFSEQVEFLSQLRVLGIEFDLKSLEIKPLYDAVEYIINSFKLAKATPAYLQFFLDVVFSYTQKHTEGVIGFLSYWNDKKDKLSIVAPESEKAIKIMTIHKAKGLEFPCVIYPYANIDIYREIEPKTWLSVNNKEYSNFEEVFIDYNKNISDYGVNAQEIVLDRQAQLELDAFNLLYVVLTRAEEQLYVISKLEVTSKGESNPNKFSGKFINYLKNIGLWDQEKTEYTFGNPSRPYHKEKDIEGNETNVVKLSRFNDFSRTYKVHIITNSGKLWDTSQMNAIEKGNLIHDLMSLIYTDQDVVGVINEAYIKGEITILDKEAITKELMGVVKHPELYQYFSEGNTVYNERDIVFNGKLFRPDRVVVDKNGITTIIDYKTGTYDASHANQILEYSRILQEMGYTVINKILIYFDHDITLKYI
ncbi:exodeoxyribonuclease V subunit beta [Aquimarina sp. AU474]|uniref:UvrD-helicase domain-containing protein n=1 Tax=Aquimarina sp. AU474 TaxID=2108529 RepID=UPI000D690CBB|nr:UvrD-helicase domain-containing protein [Aquimarina sp. AU474]